MATASLSAPASGNWRRRYTDAVVGTQNGATGAYVAFCIAQAFPHRIPRPDELRARFGMCRSTAYRLIDALKMARGAL